MAEDTDTPLGGVTFDAPSTAEPPRIYPLVADDGNRRVLREWLADHDAYAVADTDEPLTAAGFDLCIVDQGGLRRYADAIETVKSAAAPALVPVLLLVSEVTPDLLEVDRGELADNAFATTVDELISLPIRQSELAWRIRALLRLRDQSLELHSRAEALRRFREAVEASGHAIWIGDADGTIEYVNPAFEATTGYAAESAVGEHASMLRASSEGDRDERVWETVEAGNTWRGEVIHRWADGERAVVDQTVAPIVDDDAVTATVAVLIDVTDERALEDRLKQHRHIVQRLDDPIMLQDRSGNFVLFNEALVEFAGIPRSALSGADEYAFMDDETATRIERQKDAVLRTESPVHYAISPTFEHSGKEAFFSTSRYPYYDEDDELAGTLAICRDVTDLEERTRQLRVMDNVLRHNIRNDMNVIRGIAADLREQTTGESAAAAATVVSHADDLLSTSEKSRAITAVLSEEVTRRPIDVAATARRVAADLDDDHSAATVVVDVPAEARALVTDEIQTAVTELAANAITHHDRESPHVEIRVVDRPAEDVVTIAVIDDGPGMPDLDREVLVSGRAIESLSHGSGLGLWLVYWIVHRAAGSIAVTDRDPRGTSVTMSLPRVDD
jgi:PAS domain S-box-containing protein